jgi:hypothetical protein
MLQISAKILQRDIEASVNGATFLAVICGCNAGRFREALHEVYLPRIQRGKASFAANLLGARGALLSVLAHFFEGGRWELPLQIDIEAQSLTAEDQLFILLQAGQYLTSTRGLGSFEARICYEHAESLCRAPSRFPVLFSALEGQWRYSLTTDKLTTSLQIANRVYSLAEEQNEPSLMIGACSALAITHYCLGNFETGAQRSECSAIAEQLKQRNPRRQPHETATTRVG